MLNSFPRRKQRLETVRSLAAGIACALLLPIAAPAADNARILPIVNGYGLLIGGTRDGMWISDKATHAAVVGGETYRLYGAAGSVGESVGGKPALSEASGNAYNIQFADRKSEVSAGLIGIAAKWNAMPRLAKVQSRDQKVYLAEVAKVLAGHGLRRAVPRITKILRVDLTGKGQESVIIEAASPGFSVSNDSTRPSGALKTYSFVMLRTPAANGVRSTVLAGEYSRKGDDSVFHKYAIGQVLDLNGDGAMEIVVETSYYEGGGDQVFEVKNGRPKLVLQVEDGA
jgi:hypothetical protein